MWIPMLLHDATRVTGFNMAVAEVGWRRSREVRLLQNIVAVYSTF
jgi:hypothetical protein